MKIDRNKLTVACVCLTFTFAHAQTKSPTLVKDSAMISEATRIARILGVSPKAGEWERDGGTLGVIFRNRELSVGFSKATGNVSLIHNLGLRNKRMNSRPSQKDKFVTNRAWSEHGIKQLRKIWPKVSLKLLHVRRLGEDSLYGRKWSSSSNTVLIHWQNETAPQKQIGAGFDRGTGQLLSVTGGPVSGGMVGVGQRQ